MLQSRTTDIIKTMVPNIRYNHANIKEIRRRVLLRNMKLLKLIQPSHAMTCPNPLTYVRILYETKEENEKVYPRLANELTEIKL